MRYGNLTIIGTSHVSAQSVKEVQDTILKEKPGIIAIELDRDRLEALLHKRKRGMFMRGVGLKGALFALIGAWIEKAVGKIVNVEPGSEMKAAVELAKKQHAKLALIDQHISITLSRFSQSLTWREKWRFVGDMIFGMFMPARQMKRLRLGKEDLYKVPDKHIIKKLLGFVKRRYPNVYNVLVHERNIYMSHNLIDLMKRFPDETIVAVMGAGHEDAVMEYIKQNI